MRSVKFLNKNKTIFFLMTRRVIQKRYFENLIRYCFMSNKTIKQYYWHMSKIAKIVLFNKFIWHFHLTLLYKIAKILTKLSNNNNKLYHDICLPNKTFHLSLLLFFTKFFIFFFTI